MANRDYQQGVASLGATGCPHNLTLRINPSEVKWNFSVNTAVTETVGGRVVQVLGAKVSDLTVSGQLGHESGPGARQPWLAAEGFLAQLKGLLDWQSRGATVQGSHMQRGLIFSYPPKNWRFEVYLKSVTDSEGNGVTHTTAKYLYDYRMTMVIINDLTNAGRIIGNDSGAVSENITEKAIVSYINQISDGIGWRISKYNGNGSWNGYGNGL